MDLVCFMEKGGLGKGFEYLFVRRVLGRMKEKDLVWEKIYIARRCVKVEKLVFYFLFFPCALFSF